MATDVEEYENKTHEYDQERPQSQTTDKLMTPRGRDSWTLATTWQQ